MMDCDPLNASPPEWNGSESTKPKTPQKMNKAHTIIAAHGQTLDGWEGSDLCLDLETMERLKEFA